MERNCKAFFARRGRYVAAGLMVILAAGGCKSGYGASGSGTNQPTAPSAAPQAAGGSCHAKPGPLPDPSCTPGVTNPSVTQANIDSTICKSGWTATVRPPVSYTNGLKRQQITAYGYADTKTRDFEEDHFIPLELGGSPSDPRNLWPEPGATPNPKDKVENDLNHAVCSGRVPLAAAQQAIAADWLTAEKTLGIG